MKVVVIHDVGSASVAEIIDAVGGDIGLTWNGWPMIPPRSAQSSPLARASRPSRSTCSGRRPTWPSGTADGEQPRHRRDGHRQATQRAAGFTMPPCGPKSRTSAQLEALVASGDENLDDAGFW
jgi:hypothetical protein